MNNSDKIISHTTGIESRFYHEETFTIMILRFAAYTLNKLHSNT